ncbi:MAR-binding filament-like protein 1-1 [Papilio machaon]|uniref:MAR-binding filament-like protein 1-1 n=1 Tax=Papilio machaon TaxID=76193 RepID=UPI001E663BB4|nr:MAR-binding filament-like protein 1-1 [Papilio machaon]
MKSLRLWWCVAAILLVCSPPARCRNVTTEDIRDAMLSLIHMFRVSEDKLERHEFRERTFGEQLKKMVAGLEKRHRALEPMKGIVSRLDERLSNVETILFQKEEREKEQRKKTEDTLEEIKKSIQALTETVKTIKTQHETAPAEVEDNLTTKEDSLATRLDGTDQKLDAIQNEMEELKNSLTKESLQLMCSSIASASNPFERHISEAEKLLNKYELKLNEYNGTASKVMTDFVPLNEVALADDAWHNKMTSVMERQEAEIKKIQQLLSDAESTWKELPRRSDTQLALNITLESIESIRHNITDDSDNTVEKISTKLREMSDRLATTNGDIQNSLTQSNTMSERAYNDISRSYATLLKEVQALSKNEHVMLQTADNVIANKKRIDHGMHQILLEMRELVKAQTMHLNNTLVNSINATETSIVNSQMNAMMSLTAKIESEMTQVWRQIGSMYQQLSASKASLDKLTGQTEQYVNGSAATMQSMKEKVTLITTRMAEVDDNLNYLLGRLSLVTQEFSQIKTGLGEALDKAKSNLLTVQSKINGNSAGPHDIDSEEKGTN